MQVIFYVGLGLMIYERIWPTESNNINRHFGGVFSHTTLAFIATRSYQSYFLAKVLGPLCGFLPNFVLYLQRQRGQDGNSICVMDNSIIHIFCFVSGIILVYDPNLLKPGMALNSGSIRNSIRFNILRIGFFRPTDTIQQ